MLVKIYCLFFFSFDMFKAADVPIIVDNMAVDIANSNEFKNALKIILSLKSSKNHLNVNPLKIILDLVALQANMMTTTKGIYKNKKTKAIYNLDIVFFEHIFQTLHSYLSLFFVIKIISIISAIKKEARADPSHGLYNVPINCDSIRSPIKTQEPPPKSLGIKKEQEQDTKTTETPEIMPGMERGNIIYLKVFMLLAPRSSLACIMFLSMLLIVVYIGIIMNGRKSYAITIIIATGVLIIFIGGMCNVFNRLFKRPFLSKIVSHEYVLSSKFVHMGRVMNIIMNFFIILVFILQAMYEKGYDIKRQSAVASVVKNKDFVIILK